MARSPIPNPLERRHLVERALSPEQARRIADGYLAEGRTVEAVDFLVKAEAEEALAELRARAVSEGDAFLLRATARARGEMPRREEWEALAEVAERVGKDRYAAEARRQAERGDD